MGTGLMETRRVASVDPNDREQWLNWRRGRITASDMAAVMGLSPYRTALDVYAEKIGEGAEQPETMPMRIGKALEGGIARLYEQETGRTIAIEQLPVECVEHPFLAATLDAVTTCGRVVELKTAGSSRAREIGDEGTDELPESWLVQAHTQLIVDGSDEMDFGVLRGGRSMDFAVYTVRRNDEVAAAIVEAAAAFNDRLIARNPPPIVRPSDVRYLPLFPEGEAVELPSDLRLAWDEYEAVGRQVSDLNRFRDGLKARFHAALGTASIGTFDDGSRLVRKLVARKEYTCAATTYATLTFKGAN